LLGLLDPDLQSKNIHDGEISCLPLLKIRLLSVLFN